MSDIQSRQIASPLRWLLLASLGLNLALGLALGLHLWRTPPGWEPGIPGPRALRQAVPEASQPLLRSVFDQHRPALRGAMRERRQARREVRQLLAADDFQRDSAESALAVLRERDQAASAAAHAVLLDLLVQMAPAERQQLVEGMLQRRRHGPDAERRQQRREQREADARGGSDRSEPRAEGSGPRDQEESQD
jgi:uncharacterized membrane protein